MRIHNIVILFLCFSLLSCGITKINTPKREFRGVWIATVVNIDWPKHKTDAVSKQQQDFIALLEYYKSLHFNAVIVQVRTAGDAFYPSKLAPWSEYLTGEQGNPPTPFYDPLKWMITESHKRGLEFHAWLNPYRATMSLDTTKLSTNHDFYVHRDWMIKYGNRYYYNPGLPQVQKHLTAIVKEVVERYDVDAIHFDDYFYPYKIKDEFFNDTTSYKLYALPNQSIEDWRRANVDSLIYNIHKTIKSSKPYVQFGISPFGVWRNASVDERGSNTQAGQTNYDDLYADPLTWMKNGWIDYLAPQLYWRIKHPKVSHSLLIDWWSKNTQNTNLYIGNAAYRVKTANHKDWNKKSQLPKQLNLARENKQVKGNIFFSAKSLYNKHQKVTNLIKRKVYYSQSLTPKSPLLTQTKPPSKPKLISIKNLPKAVNFTFKINDSSKIRSLLFYASNSEEKIREKNVQYLITKIPVQNNTVTATILKKAIKKFKYIAFSVVDVYREESNVVLLKRTPQRGDTSYKISQLNEY